MMGLQRLPIRARLTLAFAAAMAVLFSLIAVSLYVREARVLLDEIDSGLRFRAEALEADAPRAPSLAEPAAGLIESNEAFAQLAGADGTVLRSSPGLTTPLLRADQLAKVTGPTFVERRVPGVAGEARLLAVPLDDPMAHVVIVVGTSMSDRIDALHQFKVFLGIAGPLALGLALLAGWGVAGLALRPVERMRQQASAISASGMDRRLPLPAAKDEIRRLGETLNEMLTRLDEAVQSERRLLDRASHELRTPLTALKAELDLALSQPRTAAELSAALNSASEEADRMARLADDLLVLARANNGRLPLHLQPTSLRRLAGSASRLFRARAESSGVRIEVTATDAIVDIDAARVRQAIDNLLDNALRYSPAGGTVELKADLVDEIIRIEVTDGGPGFPAGNGRGPLEAFDRTGLGLEIARAVAESHRGTVTAANEPGRGARVTMTLRHGELQE